MNEGTAYATRPWRVHDLASDFRVLDTWRVPIDADPAAGDDFADFYRVFVENGVATDSGAAGVLFRIRQVLGRVFRIDDGPALPIPGCTETSVADRLSEANRARNLAGPAGDFPFDVRPIYRFEEEALFEVSNRTIHALIHLGWVDAAGGRKTAELAILIKSRGLLSDAYMALIGPFRHALIYPALMKKLGRSWDERPRRDAAAA